VYSSNGKGKLGFRIASILRFFAGSVKRQTSGGSWQVSCGCRLPVIHIIPKIVSIDADLLMINKLLKVIDIPSFLLLLISIQQFFSFISNFPKIFTFYSRLRLIRDRLQSLPIFNSVY
jgi:hypothetical protein